MTLVPNALSAIRLFASLVAAAFVASHPREHVAGVVIVMIAIGIATDFLDGSIARSLGCASRFGTRLDIVADLACFALLPCTYAATAGAPFMTSAPAYLLGAYALMRIRPNWRCRGLPLPVVGTMIVMLLFMFRHDTLLFDSSAFAMMLTAFISLARDGRRTGPAAARVPTAARVR